MKAKVTIDGKEHEITLTEDQIKMVKNKSWEDEYRNNYIETIARGDGAYISISATLYEKTNSFSFMLQKDIILKLHEKAKLLMKMTQFALLTNDGWVARWHEINQQKYGILRVSSSEFRCIVDNSYHRGYDSPPLELEYKEYNHFVFGIAVKTREIAEEMLSIFKGDIEKYY